MIHWDEKLSVGIRQFDDHHKELIRIINEIFESTQRKEEYHFLKNLIFELVSYTKYHFSAEERIMMKNNYQHLNDHMIEHKKLTNQVVKFLEDYSLHKKNLADDVLEFLKKWLIDHILSTDKKMGEYLVRRGLQ